MLPNIAILCALGQYYYYTPVPTPAATPAPTPAATPAPTPAATPAATPAPTPAATPAPTPAATLAATPASTLAATLAATPAATSTAALDNCDVIFDYGGSPKQITACAPSVVCARWQGTHNAHYVSSQHEFDTCFVPSHTTDVFYAGHVGRFAAPDAGTTHRFVCSIPGHCANGAKFAISCPGTIPLGNPATSSSTSKYKTATIVLGVFTGIFLVLIVALGVTMKRVCGYKSVPKEIELTRG